MSNEAVKRAVDYLGGPSQVARELGMTPWAVSKWSISMPPRRVLWLAARTDFRFTPHELAPSLYPNPTDALPSVDRSESAFPIDSCRGTLPGP